MTAQGLGQGHYLVNNLAERIHKIKFKYEHDDGKFEMWGIKYRDCECFLEYRSVKYIN